MMSAVRRETGMKHKEIVATIRYKYAYLSCIFSENTFLVFVTDNTIKKKKKTFAPVQNEMLKCVLDEDAESRVHATTAVAGNQSDINS